MAAAETPEPSATATPTLPVISSGSVPGAASGQGTEAAGAAATPVQAAAEPTATPASADAPAAATAAPSASPTGATPAAVGAAATAPATAPTSAAPAPAPTGRPAATTVVAASPAGGPDLAALAQRMLERVNADRTANGLQPVAWDDTAAAAGQQHSEEMAAVRLHEPLEHGRVRAGVPLQPGGRAGYVAGERLPARATSGRTAGARRSTTGRRSLRTRRRP